MSDERSNIDMYMGVQIKERRRAIGMTQADLAHLMHLSPQQIQRYESGENTLSVSRILEIAKHLNVKPSYFYENAPNPQNSTTPVDKDSFLKHLNRPIRILLVEDTFSDELLFRKAVDQSSVPAVVQALSDPETVVDVLMGQRNQSPDDGTDLLILDINMPRMNGITLLQNIRAKPELKNLPIVMMTNSARRTDMLAAYSNFANGFVQKNSDLFEFFSEVKLILNYWSRAITLPTAV